MIKPELKIEHLPNEGTLRITMDIQLENMSDYMFREINRYVTQKSFRDRHQSLYDSLSEREKEIFGLVLNNHTNIQIAEHLHIAYNTVRTHRKNMMEKLQCKARKELMKFKDFS